MPKIEAHYWRSCEASELLRASALFTESGYSRTLRTSDTRQAHFEPRWRSDGRELFYLDLDGRLMAVPVTFSSDAKAVTVGAASPLFATRIGGSNTLQSQYVVSPDGQRFLLDTPVRDDSPPIHVILNWRPVPSTSTNSF